MHYKEPFIPRKVTEYLQEAEKSRVKRVSFELIPPKRGEGVYKRILPIAYKLRGYNPAFIDITSHPPESVEIPIDRDGKTVKKILEKSRPGTAMGAVQIQAGCRVATVPHILCRGFDLRETEEFAVELYTSGARNIFAVRGDVSLKELGRVRNASELINQLRELGKGNFVREYAEPPEALTDLCIGAAAHPEGHPESPNMETYMEHLVEKVNAGADFLVTQMFFRNEHYFGFVEGCRRAGINVPIIPGIKIIDKGSDVQQIPPRFHCEIPYDLTHKISHAEDRASVLEFGVQHAADQIEGLFREGVPLVHLYVMLDYPPVEKLMNELVRRELISFNEED